MGTNMSGVDLSQGVLLGLDRDRGVPMTMDGIRGRAAVRWVEPFSRSVDLDQAHADMMYVTSALQLLRAQAASLLVGLGARVGDESWGEDPAAWQRLGARIAEDLTAVGVKIGAESASREKM
jgi:hypothetical protein